MNQRRIIRIVIALIMQEIFKKTIVRFFLKGSRIFVAWRSRREGNLNSPVPILLSGRLSNSDCNSTNRRQRKRWFQYVCTILPFQGVTLLLLCGVYGALAGRRYIAIPVDGFDVIELSPVPPATARITRQTEAYLPVAVPSVSQEEPRSLRSERSNARILDYVDFGGQTGSNGAFSWYADYPAHH